MQVTEHSVDTRRPSITLHMEASSKTAQMYLWTPPVECRSLGPSDIFEFARNYNQLWRETSGMEDVIIRAFFYY